MGGDRRRASLGFGVLAVLLTAANGAPAWAAKPPVPAIVAPPTGEHHVGKVIFMELVTPDLAAAEHFYGALFGWSFRDSALGGMKYGEASLDGEAVAGIVQKTLPVDSNRGPAWLSFMAVRDVDAANTVAVQHGAKTLFEPRDVPDRGRQAILVDPQGAVFAILASSTGDPSDMLAAPGEWIWSSLLTKDPDQDAAFYQDVFGYEVFELPNDDNGAEHLLLASDNYARASANTLPLDKPDLHPHWLNYVRVDDAGKMAAEVTSLGGRVLVEPRLDRHGGKLAIVADPEGAPFGLLEWPETASKEVAK